MKGASTRTRRRKIFVGTSGYSYADWRGPFYPADLADRDMLSFYARRFPAVEVNYTYYRWPAARTMAGMVRKAPGMTFAVKVTGEMTHEGKLTREGVATFRAGVAPMATAGVLACLLAQFPWGFKYSAAALEFVAGLARALAEYRLVAEFRNASWATEDVYAALRELGVGFCNVDEPRLRGLMPATDVVTADVAYFRFHGRNAKNWWKHDDAAQRYLYQYSQEELAEWVPRIRGAAAKAGATYVFMNNHPLGHATANAAMMMEMLGETFGAQDDAALF